MSPETVSRHISGVAHNHASSAHDDHLHVHLSDGSELQIRRVTRDDREALVAGFNRLSKQSRYTRFFTPMPTLSGPVLDRLAGLVGHCHVAIAAFCLMPKPVGEFDNLEDEEVEDEEVEDEEVDAVEDGIGVARAIQDCAGVPAELAVTVIDDATGHGIGELLLRILLVVTHEMGVDEFRATALRENQSMRKTFVKLGARSRADPQDASILLFELSYNNVIETTEWTQEFVDEVLSFAKAVT
jgi:GNAT superfamily N-acetyltransferase